MKRPNNRQPRVPNRLRDEYDRDRLAWSWMGYRDVSLNAAYRATDRLLNTPHVTIAAADRWCIALGTHLCFVYPELYRDEEAA